MLNQGLMQLQNIRIYRRIVAQSRRRNESKLVDVIANQSRQLTCILCIRQELSIKRYLRYCPISLSENEGKFYYFLLVVDICHVALNKLNVDVSFLCIKKKKLINNALHVMFNSSTNGTGNCFTWKLEFGGTLFDFRFSPFILDYK